MNSQKYDNCYMYQQHKQMNSPYSYIMNYDQFENVNKNGIGNNVLKNNVGLVMLENELQNRGNRPLSNCDAYIYGPTCFKAHNCLDIDTLINNFPQYSNGMLRYNQNNPIDKYNIS